MTVTWSAVSGATGYVLQLGKMEEDEVVGYDDFPTTGLSYTVTNLHSITRYYYRVKSKNAAGEGSPSPVASLVTKAPPPPQVAPPKPTSGQWDVRHSNGKMQFKLTSLPTVTPAVSQVQAILETGEPPNNNLVTHLMGTGLNSWVTVLSSGDAKWRTGSWAAQIRFKNSVGYSPYSTGKSITVPIPPPPPSKPIVAPSNVQASATHNSVTVTWNAVSGATGYDMQLGVMEEDDEIGYANYPTTGLTYTVGNVKSNTRHYYRVRARNSAGNGPWSAEASIVTKSPPAPPKPPTPPPPVTHVWSHSSYTGCGPGRKQIQACSNGHSRHTRTVNASEPLIWYDWEYTGRTHYDDADGKLYKEQRRTSHCGDTETRWVAS